MVKVSPALFGNARSNGTHQQRFPVAMREKQLTKSRHPLG